MVLLLSGWDQIISSKEFWTLEAQPGLSEKDEEINMHQVSVHGLNFIDSLLMFDAKKRPTIDEMLDSPYMKDFDNVVETSPTLGELIVSHFHTFYDTMSDKIFYKNTLIIMTKKPTFHEFWANYKDVVRPPPENRKVPPKKRKSRKAQLVEHNKMTILLLGNMKALEAFVEAYSNKRYVAKESVGMKKLRLDFPVKNFLEMHLID